MRELERVYLLKNVDNYWMEHIDAMDELKKGIRLRSYGQHDPVVEYRLEGFDMFDDMIKCIREDTIKMLMVIPKRVSERLKKQDEMRELAVKRAAGGRARAAAQAAIRAQQAARAALNVQVDIRSDDDSDTDKKLSAEKTTITVDGSTETEDPVQEQMEAEAVATTEDELEKKEKAYSDERVQEAAAQFMKREQVAKPTVTNLEGDGTVVNRTVKKVKIGRNDPCPCGSGKKYKKCCGANQ